MYKISAAALHASNNILAHFELHERKDVIANVNNVARLIDLHTQVHKIETVLRGVFAKTQWLNAEELSLNLTQTRELLREIQRVTEGLPKFQKPGELSATAASYTAAKVLMEYYVFNPKSTGRIPLTLRNIAVIIESSCAVCRLEELNQSVQDVLGLDPTDLHKHVQYLRQTLRALEVVKNRLPAFAPPRKQLRAWKKVAPPKVAPEKQQELKLVAEALQNAKTPIEQAAIMRKAGLA